MFEIVVTGLIASLAMISVMYLITKAGLANADMIRAIGGLVTRSYHNAFGIGLVTYFAFGIGFTFLYWKILELVPQNFPVLVLAFAGFSGLVHGLLVGFALVIEVAGRHPLPQFREAGFSVAIAHIVGHVVYGIFVGLGLIYWNHNFGLLEEHLLNAKGAIYFMVFLSLALIGLIVTALLNRDPRHRHVKAHHRG